MRTVLNVLIALVIAAFVIWAATASHAGEIVTSYDYYPSGGRMLSGAPKWQSMIGMSFDVPAGPLVVGSDIQASQISHAGLIDERWALHAGRMLQLGKLALTPAVILGYARALEDEYGFAGAEVKARFAVSSRLSLQARVRAWESFAEVEQYPTGQKLPALPRRQLQLFAGPEIAINPHMGVGIEGGHDFGESNGPMPGTTLAGSHVGTYLRMTF